MANERTRTGIQCEISVILIIFGDVADLSVIAGGGLECRCPIL